MIGVFDSGIGGLSVLEELEKVLPNEDFYYYGDSINNPYGEKSDQELLEITSHIVDVLKEKGAKIIVIACNTATTRVMKKLREKYPKMIFVGTVPAIKVASDHDSKNTLVMATEATIHSLRTAELIRDNKRKDQNIYLVSCPGLANAIETKNEEKIKNILGCTHYPFIKKEILEEMPGVKLVDGSHGVSMETKRQLTENDLLNGNVHKRKIIIYNSLTKTKIVK